MAEDLDGDRHEKVQFSELQKLSASEIEKNSVDVQKHLSSNPLGHHWALPKKSDGHKN